MNRSLSLRNTSATHVAIATVGDLRIDKKLLQFIPDWSLSTSIVPFRPNGVIIVRPWDFKNSDDCTIKGLRQIRSRLIDKLLLVKFRRNQESFRIRPLKKQIFLLGSIQTD